MRKLGVIAAALALPLTVSAAALADGQPTIPGASGTVWVTERTPTSSSLTAYDAATGEVLRHTPVGSAPIGVTVPPGTQKVYTSDENANQMSVIDRETGTVIKTIPMGPRPHHLMHDPNGRYVYVAEFGANTIGIVDTDLDARVGQYVASANPGARTHALWIEEHGQYLYATNAGTANTISKIDVQTGALVWELPIGANPSEILVTPDQKTAYVSVRNENKIRIVDIGGDSPLVVGDQVIGTQPDTLQLTNDRQWLIVGLRGTPATMALMNTDTLAVRHVALTGTTTGHQWLSANSKYTFIAIENPGGLAVVDNEAGAQVAFYPYPNGLPRPHGVYYEPRRLR